MRRGSLFAERRRRRVRNFWISVGVVAILAFGLWFFLIYDSAQGRCNRGDLGACIVVSAQQQPGH